MVRTAPHRGKSFSEAGGDLQLEPKAAPSRQGIASMSGAFVGMHRSLGHVADAFRSPSRLSMPSAFHTGAAQAAQGSSFEGSEEGESSLPERPSVPEGGGRGRQERGLLVNPHPGPAPRLLLHPASLMMRQSMGGGQQSMGGELVDVQGREGVRSMNGAVALLKEQQRRGPRLSITGMPWGA